MGSIKALFYASVVAVGAVQIAQAADLLPPPPPIEAPPLRGAIDPSGFYLRADVGVGINNGYDLRSTYGDGYSTNSSLSATDGAAYLGDSTLVGLGAGYQFNSWLRADVTGEYRSSAAYNTKVTYFPAANSGWACFGQAGNEINCGDQYSAMVRSGLFLANAYLDMGTWYGITPYVGAGVGMASYNVSNLTDTSLSNQNAWGVAPDKSGANFAWALMAGMSWNVAPNLKLDIGYRYANMGSLTTGVIGCTDSTTCHYETQHFNLASNDIRVGLRWMVDPGMPYEPGYVRAKY